MTRERTGLQVQLAGQRCPSCQTIDSLWFERHLPGGRYRPHPHFPAIVCEGCGWVDRPTETNIETNIPEVAA